MEYYDSKEWAKAQNILWKGVLDDVQTEQWCWWMMKAIMDSSDADLEQKIEVAKAHWRQFVQAMFPMKDA